MTPGPKEQIMDSEQITTAAAAAVDHAVTHVLGDLGALEAQQAEVRSQYNKVAHSATDETLQQLKNEWTTIADQVKRAGTPIIKGWVSLVEGTKKQIQDQKETIVKQHEALRQQRGRMDEHFKNQKRPRPPGLPKEGRCLCQEYCHKCCTSKTEKGIGS